MKKQKSGLNQTTFEGARSKKRLKPLKNGFLMKSDLKKGFGMKKEFNIAAQSSAFVYLR